jgi:hypothetical protein
MSSEKQILANRLNAQKSTGPKTANGKAASRTNAFKHGLLSEDVIIPGEDPEKFAYLNSQLERELEPIGFQEAEIVERMAAFMWRLRRLHRVEAGIFVHERAGAGLNQAGEMSASYGLAFIRDANGANAFTKLSRYETMMERSLSRLRMDLERLQRARKEYLEERPVIIDHVDESDC